MFMLKNKKLMTIICSSVCMLVIAILIALQFTPYWTFTDSNNTEQTISIGDYVWFPNEDVSNDFEDEVKATVFPGQRMTDNKVVNEIVMYPAITFGIAVFAFITCFLGRKNQVVTGIATLITGAVGIIGYVSSPSLALSSSWTLHLVVAVVVVVPQLHLSFHSDQ